MYTGYKLRRQISKALQRRSEAIRAAINRYNVQAEALQPPRPKISWKDIAEYSFLGEFDVLRYSREDVRSNDWTRPAFREATTKFFKLQRAREEVVRLNVEIRRLRTAIHDEEQLVVTKIQELTNSNVHLALELRRSWQERAAINKLHVHRLAQIQCLPGFSGTLDLGVREVRGGMEACPAGCVGTEGRNDYACGPEAEKVIYSEYCNADVLEQNEDDMALEMFSQYIESIND